MDYRVIILRKLFRHRYIGGKHTAIENLTKGLPKHAIGEAKQAVKELIKEKLLIEKPTSYGLQVSLNSQKLEGILRIIEQS